MQLPINWKICTEEKWGKCENFVISLKYLNSSYVGILAIKTWKHDFSRLKISTLSHEQMNYIGNWLGNHRQTNCFPHFNHLHSRRGKYTDIIFACKCKEKVYLKISTNSYHTKFCERVTYTRIKAHSHRCILNVSFVFPQLLPLQLQKHSILA